MDFKESPQHQNHMAPVVALISFLVGLVLFFLSMHTAYPALLQALMLVAMVFGVCLLARHHVHYIYRLESDANGGESMDLVVEQQRGRQRMVVCRLGVSDVREIEHQTPENRKQIKKKYADQGDTVHAYCADVFPTRSTYLRFDDGGQRVIIRLQASEALLDVFRSALDTAR